MPKHQPRKSEIDPFARGVRLGIDPLQAIALALGRIADELSRYNTAHEKPVAIPKEAEAFRASYERDDPERRELHNFLTGEEAAVSRRRASRLPNRGGKKASRRDEGNDGGGS